MLITFSRNYELRCANEKDRAKWAQIFRIIILMNKEAVTTYFMNPFDFDQKRKELETLKIDKSVKQSLVSNNTISSIPPAPVPRGREHQQKPKKKNKEPVY